MADPEPRPIIPPASANPASPYVLALYHAEAAMKRGVRFGRPPSLTPEQLALGKWLVAEGTSVRVAA